MASKFNPIQYAESDGLKVMEVGNWAEYKYKIVGKYCDIFTKGMKNKWNLVYIDLFCGPGFVKKRNSNEIMLNSALIAASLPNKFDYYALNDFDEESCSAIENRLNKIVPSKYKVFSGDANKNLDTILNSIPNFNNEKRNLIFSFLDPFSLNLEFETIKKLNKEQADILVLHALQMDARRNHKIYKEKPEKVSKFTGNPNWQESYKKYQDTPTEFMKFVSEEFDRSINNLGYKITAKKERIKNDSGMGIYYLCFYSKHDRGLDFYSKIQRIGGNNQYELF
jgi:three-Cys-motif partner protein